MTIKSVHGKDKENICIFMHLADAFIQSDLQCIQAIPFFSIFVFIYYHLLMYVCT